MRLVAPFVLSILALPGGAQGVVLTRITDLTTPVHGAGNRPALDGGLVAFLGEDVATGVWGVYLTPVDGQGPLTLVADQNTPIPNVPGETFLSLDNPEIHDGIVAFTGGFELSFIDKQGVYMGDGGPLTVHYDAAAALYNPQPFAPIVDGDDLAFRSISPNVSDPTTAPYYMPAANVVVPIGGPLPGGGSLASMNPGDYMTLAGGLAAYSATVTHEGSTDDAVYSWDVVDRTLELVANWNTQIPGQALFFEYFGAVDTDGSAIVFTGQHGLLGFGGHQGVYLVPAGAGGMGPFTPIAEVGQTAPGGSAAFASFGDVAIDGELVVFEAWLGSVAVPSGQGIYGWRGGQLFKILDDSDTVDGKAILGADMNLRGLDGNRLALRVTFVNPTFPNLALDFGIYVAQILNGTSFAPYCSAGTSASGCRALLSASGEPSASLAGGFSLSADNVEGGKDGMFFFGTGGRQANPWGNGTSYQCVVPPVVRAGLLSGAGTSGLCDGSFSQDLNALWCPSCPKPGKNPGAGAVVQAQLWYRDPQNTSNQTTSLPDAIEFSVAP